MAYKVFLITSDVIGRSEDELGELLMANFLRLLGESQEKPSYHDIFKFRGTPGL